MNLRDITILNIIGFEYNCIISGISESEAIKFVQNADLNGKRETLQIIKICYHT